MFEPKFTSTKVYNLMFFIRYFNSEFLNCHFTALWFTSNWTEQPWSRWWRLPYQYNWMKVICTFGISFSVFSWPYSFQMKYVCTFGLNIYKSELRNGSRIKKIIIFPPTVLTCSPHRKWEVIIRQISKIASAWSICASICSLVKAYMPVEKNDSQPNLFWIC